MCNRAQIWHLSARRHRYSCAHLHVALWPIVRLVDELVVLDVVDLRSNIHLLVRRLRIKASSAVLQTFSVQCECLRARALRLT